MDPQFMVHNLHWQSMELFSNNDPQLFNLKKQPYIYRPELIQQLPTKLPGIYTLGGGRQIGKTTLLKQWMHYLLQHNIVNEPQSLYFLTGEIIPDHLALIQTIQTYLEQSQNLKTLKFIIIDEVTYIKEWDRGIKYLVDSNALENIIVILTGSDLTMIQQARMRFPGRRGTASQVDFHLNSLSFYEFVTLKLQQEHPSVDTLYVEFDNYLQHGGFLTAINNIAVDGSISPATYRTYSDWIRGDVIKHRKNESYLKDLLMAIIKTYGTQITWNSLADHTIINHPNTLQEYAHILEYMDVIFIQSALMEDKLCGSPKKAKKIIFKDPFIYHAIYSWLYPLESSHAKNLPALIESCVVSHYQRFYPCYYIKAGGEIDLAYINQNKFYPIEVKWTNQLRAKDLKQIGKYKNSLIVNKSLQSGFVMDQIPTQPLPINLFELGKKFAS